MCWISRKEIIKYEDDDVIETVTVYMTGQVVDVIGNIGYCFDPLIDATITNFRVDMG